MVVTLAPMFVLFGQGAQKKRSKLIVFRAVCSIGAVFGAKHTVDVTLRVVAQRTLATRLVQLFRIAGV